VRTNESRLARLSGKTITAKQTLHVFFEGEVTETMYDDFLGAGGRMDEMRFFDNLTPMQ
jgi:hypothetical protein